MSFNLAQKKAFVCDLDGTLFMGPNPIQPAVDFVIENTDGVLQMRLNDDEIPELHVSREYRDMAKDLSSGATPTPKQKEAIRFAKAKVDAAVWFIDAIRQRNQTLTRTMEAIMRRQQAYLLEGDKSLPISSP